jgi:peptide/nickel transport system substrate-binding protein
VEGKNAYLAPFGAPPALSTIGRWTVVVRSKIANPFMIYWLDGILGGTYYSYVISPTCIAHPALLNTESCGAGPYMVVPSDTVLGSRYTLVPNPYYYDSAQQPWSKVVDISIPSPTSMLQAMESGEIDVADFGDPSTSAAARRAGFRVWYMGHGHNYGIFLDLIKAASLGAPALNNLKVRQAMNYAINRPLLAKTFGGATPTDEVVTQYGYDPKYQNYYKYDPSKAKALLTAAGYSQGFSFTVDVSPPAGLGSYGVPQMQAVASQLAKIGITMHIDADPSGTDFNKDPAFQGVLGLAPTTVYGQIFSAYVVNDPTLASLVTAGSMAASPRLAQLKFRAFSERTVKQAYMLATLFNHDIIYQNPHKVSDRDIETLFQIVGDAPVSTNVPNHL